MTNAKNTSLWVEDGTAQTPGVASAPVSLPMDNTTTSGLTITLGSSPPASLPALQINNSSGSAIFQIFPSSVQANGINIGALGTLGAGVTGFAGKQATVPLLLQDGTSSAGVMQMWSGTGAPSSSTVGTAAVGDVYLRRDGAGAANVNLYVCTVAGAPGTWTGIA